MDVYFDPEPDDEDPIDDWTPYLPSPHPSRRTT